MVFDGDLYKQKYVVRSLCVVNKKKTLDIFITTPLLNEFKSSEGEKRHREVLRKPNMNSARSWVRYVQRRL